MKKLFTFLNIAIALLISINIDIFKVEANNDKEYNVDYYSEIYEPINENSTLDINGGLKILNGPSKDNLIIRYELYSPIKFKGTRHYSTGNLSNIFSYPETNEFNYSFTIDDSQTNYIRIGKIIVRVGIYDLSTSKMIDYIESTLYLKTNENINIEDINGDLIYDKFLCLDEEIVTERYDFSNFSNLIDLKYYLYLDISSLSFNYYSFKPFSYKELFLSFFDKDNLFPFIKEINGEKRIELKVKVKDNAVHFIYDNLYVDLDTFNVSTYYKDGYIKTNNFYLPKNKLNHLQGLSLYINAVEIGATNLSFRFNTEIHFDSLLLGPCNLSEYCVVGGVER